MQDDDLVVGPRMDPISHSLSAATSHSKPHSRLPITVVECATKCLFLDWWSLIIRSIKGMHGPQPLSPFVMQPTHPTPQRPLLETCDIYTM